MCLGMILPKVILESQDILVSSSEGPEDGFFSLSSGGYLVGGVLCTQGSCPEGNRSTEKYVVLELFTHLPRARLCRL